MGLIVVLDLATSVMLLGPTGGAAGMPLSGFMPGASVTAPVTPASVPVNGKIVVLFAGE